ncbi:MAG: PmoA family protein [Prolixibacteraceae bacterium]|nr:PmoA family protein [Prolixibacteraceae bacterium]
MLKLLPFLFLTCLSFVGKSQINMVVKEDGFLFMEGKDSLFFYQKSPKDKDGEYSRCNYIHPLYGADNSRLTEDFPADHLHHRGIFWAWHQILIDNNSVADGWELKNFQQKVTDIEFRLQKGIGYLNTTVDWISPLWKDGSEPYLQEKTNITIYPKAGNYRRLDFEIRLNSLTDDLSIGGSDDEKGYSGFSIRLKLPEDVSFSGENGLVEPTNAAVVAGNSMKIDGSFLNDGKKGGVVMLSNPQNPEPSGSWIIRKKASMQNAAYPGRQPVAIAFDEPLVLKYSLLVYHGDMSEKQIKKAMK